MFFRFALESGQIADGSGCPLPKTGPKLTRAKRTSPEADARTLSSYTLALSRWAAMGKANSVFVAYCAKAFLASVISAPRAASFTDLAARVAENDKTIEHANRNLPDGKKSLASAELVARQLKS